MVAKIPEFECYAAYSRIDRANQGYLTGKEIYDFVRENENCHVLEADCSYLVKYFDSDPDAHSFA